MTGKYGPQTPQIEALLARIKTLPQGAIRELAALRNMAADRAAAWDATWNAAWDTTRAAAWDADAVWAAVWDTTRAVTGNAARGALWDAAVALVVRDLIGQHGFTQEHYDTLTGPWRKVVGKLHPDDEEVR